LFEEALDEIEASYPGAILRPVTRYVVESIAEQARQPSAPTSGPCGPPSLGLHQRFRMANPLRASVTLGPLPRLASGARPPGRRSRTCVVEAGGGLRPSAPYEADDIFGQGEHRSLVKIFASMHRSSATASATVEAFGSDP